MNKNKFIVEMEKKISLEKLAKIGSNQKYLNKLPIFLKEYILKNKKPNHINLFTKPLSTYILCQCRTYKKTNTYCGGRGLDLL